jgi:hypothetical protein
VRVVAVILSFLLATVFEMAGSWLCLIPTQGMHGNERFILVFLGFSIAFAVVNALGAGLGLIPLLMIYDGKAWSRTVLGFMVGSVLAALCWAVLLELRPAISILMLIIAVVSPPIGGLIAFGRTQGKQRLVQAGHGQ